MCGTMATDPGVTLQVDHVIPADLGGTDDLDNLATLCQPCNRGKSNLKLSDYWSLTLTPDDLARKFTFIQDAKFDDFEQFHLYLYYTDRTETWPREGEKFQALPGIVWLHHALLLTPVG